ncbi:SOS response-associated peptidase family protein [Sphingopyxis sp.]|jgi:putative SOS response-associated peptidase YedK|uniref:SOS response-associated peptidase n=1 Tax=Sphingopyxis sp. TaxID=1908224 RepID=UPI00312049BF
MCKLITLKASVDEVASHFKARRPKPTNASPGEVWKGGTGFVVREVMRLRQLDAMVWGFPRHSLNKRTWQPNKPTHVNNARDDKLLSPYNMWREWFLQPAHRCLIPISAFAEAVGPAGDMTRTWISIADQPLAACAGLWRPTDEWGDSYTMVMADAVTEMLEIHDRMPVILHPADLGRWLKASADEAMALVTQYPSEKLVTDRTAEPWTRTHQKRDPPRVL